MRVLITGGAGFIGSHLADRPLAEGRTVRALDYARPPGPSGAGSGRTTSTGGRVAGRRRARAGGGRRALDGMDAVFHFAAAVGVGQSMYEIAGYVSANALGAGVMLEEVPRAVNRSAS